MDFTPPPGPGHLAHPGVVIKTCSALGSHPALFCRTLRHGSAIQNSRASSIRPLSPLRGWACLQMEIDKRIHSLMTLRIELLSPLNVQRSAPKQSR